LWPHLDGFAAGENGGWLLRQELDEIQPNFPGPGGSELPVDVSVVPREARRLLPRACFPACARCNPAALLPRVHATS
jgi:hypothetical protein